MGIVPSEIECLILCFSMRDASWDDVKNFQLVCKRWKQHLSDNKVKRVFAVTNFTLIRSLWFKLFCVNTKDIKKRLENIENEEFYKARNDGICYEKDLNKVFLAFIFSCIRCRLHISFNIPTFTNFTYLIGKCFHDFIIKTKRNIKMNFNKKYIDLIISLCFYLAYEISHGKCKNIDENFDVSSVIKRQIPFFKSCSNNFESMLEGKIKIEFNKIIEKLLIDYKL